MGGFKDINGASLDKIRKWLKKKARVRPKGKCGCCGKEGRLTEAELSEKYRPVAFLGPECLDEHCSKCALCGKYIATTSGAYCSACSFKVT